MNPLLILALGILVVVGGILLLRLHAFLALILGALLVSSLTSTAQLESYAKNKKFSPKETQQIVESQAAYRITREFGDACMKIGIIIAMASIIGKCMMESGAADRIVRSITKWLGEERAAIGFLICGYLLSIPIFFDTVFLLMVPLCKAMWMRTRKNYVLYVCAVISGGSMMHSLVPPSPGPLLAANTLNVDLGRMIFMGCIVGGLTACVGMCYALWIDRRLQLPVRDSAHAPIAELEALAQRSESELPPLWLALLPILLPVIQIGARTALDIYWRPAAGAALTEQQKSILEMVSWQGNPNIALTLAAAISIATLMFMKRPDKKQMNHTMSEALASGGQILLIIAAGGAFGGALQQTGIGDVIRETISQQNLPVLPVAFLVTMFVRAAQGSATVAIITAVGMLQAIATPEHLGFHPVYLALAIGCGSKPLSWMNDSGFWVIGKMSGMNETETFKTFTAQTSLEGATGLVIVMIFSKLFPMI